MSYQKDADYTLYFRPGAEAFGYSEGAEAEQRLLDIVEGLDDRSTFAPGYLENIVDWSTRYHFSRARHCLVRPLDIGPQDRVLELGCGTGAITRYLGETGAQVTAVEGSLARARVAAARCADLPNVTVIADDLQAVDVEGQYDWVTLIGVLEYAAAYSGAPDPYQSYLAAAVRHLKPGGRLVVAIENQLGLKYFNGCGEDHLGKPFSGIQDLYQKTGGPRTFGRQALSQVLARTGLEQQQWLYPYPDYKIPSIVLTDAALKHPDFNAFDLLLRNDSEDYNDNRYRVFDEALVNRVLEENGLLGDFSNSFLVVAQRPLPVEKAAGKGKGRNARAASGKAAAAAPWQPAALAWTFAAVHRHRGMATETRFIPQAQGGIRVTKRRILPDEPVSLPLADGHTITLETADSDYFPGRQLAWRSLVAHVREGNVPAMVEALRPWCETLLSSAEVGTSPLLAAASEQGADTTGTTGDSTEAVPDAGAAGYAALGAAGIGERGRPLRQLVLPGNLMDMVPFNILINEGTGRQQIIDQEWVVSCPVPAGWVLTRGVMHSLQVGLVPRDTLGSIPRVVIALADRCGYYATPEDVQQWLALEETCLKAVSVRAVSHGLYTGTRRPVPMVLDSLAAQGTELHEQRQRAQAAEENAQVLRQQLAECSQELTDGPKRIDASRQKIEELEAQVQTLLHSRSWRWSEWLRNLRRRCRI